MIDEKKNMCGQKMLSQGTSIFNFSRYKKKNNGEIPKNRAQLNKPKNSMNSKKYDINKQKKYFFFHVN